MRTPVDLIAVIATSSGTGPFVLGAAVPGYDGIASLVNGNSYSYSVQQGSNYEVGYGTFISGTNTLSRTIIKSSYGGAPIPFQQGAQVTFTLLAEDLAALIANTGTASATAKAAFNAYGLQWLVQFNATPVASELIALYVPVVSYTYPGNFSGSATASPLISPAASWTATIDQQLGGLGAWNNIGAIGISTSGSVSLSTVSGATITINAGDRLRVLAPATADTTLVGFAVTFKGIIP